MTSETYRNYIDGEWVSSDQTTANINPSDTRDIIGHYAVADAAQTEAAVAAARAAFPGWAMSTPQQRSDALEMVAAEILARRQELGTLLSREEGKPLADGIGEAARAGQIFRFFAGEALRASGEVVPSVRPGIKVEVTREPIGVVGIIAPWNFPIAIPAWKIAPALAFGNCCVVKPADLVPGSAWALAEIISRAGLPRGVFNLIMGKGRTVGEAIVNAPGIDAITFTGSVGVGEAILGKATARRAKVQLEMGGKNPQIVLDDADLEIAVTASVQSAYYCTGQRCTASSRLIVTEGIHDRFVSAMVERVKALKVDDALAPGTEVGPVVDERQLAQDLDYVAIGQREGANLVVGGARLNRDKPGFYMQPALFTESTQAMRINIEEIFGPVASVIRVRDYDEALAVANDVEAGLSAGICTSSLKHAEHFKRHSQAGMVMVNLPTAGVDYHLPFGGRKASSYGPREQGSYAKEFYTIVKTSYVRPV